MLDWYGLSSVTLVIGENIKTIQIGMGLTKENYEMFIGAVIANFGIVAAVDKLIIGGIAGR